METTRASRSVAHVMLRLYALLGLAFVMLAGPVRAAGAAPSGPTFSPSAADAADEPCFQTRGDRVRITAHELGAVELELDDDSRSDVAAVPTAMVPAFEPVRIVRVPEHGSADSGHPLVARAHARGPPVAG